MAIAIAPNGRRHLKPWERSPWDERAMAMSGISLEDIAARYNHSNNHAPRISDSNAISNGMTPEMEAHMEETKKFNEWYANRGIDSVVKESHAGFFGKVYDAAAHGLKYAANGLGKAADSLIPLSARKALAPAVLAASLLATTAVACGPQRVYADASVNRESVSTRYDSAKGILHFTIPIDYVSNDNRPVQGFVEIYKNGILVANQPGTLNPGKGTDFIVQDSVPLGGNFNYVIVVRVPGIEDSNPGNNTLPLTVNATPTAAIPTVTPAGTAVATATSTAAATVAQKSTYELALERLNPQISQTARDFVKNLAEYNNSTGNTEELHKTYAGLERIVDIIEKHPKIVNGLNQFGTDALALLIADNLSAVDMDRYWFLTNATALQAQDFFYAGNEVYDNGIYRERMKGPLTDKKFDEKEREIVNFRLRKQIEWQGKWSTPSEYEEAVREYGSEQRASNALRRRVLPQSLFLQDIVEGGKHPSYSTFDTNTWLEVASYNNEHSEEVRAEILARLNEPERYQKDADWLIRYWKNAEKHPNIGEIAKRASEYLSIILSEGKPYERSAAVISVQAVEPKGWDIGSGLHSSWVTLVGASGGNGAAQIIHPDGHQTWDPQYMFTVSRDTEQKLKGVVVYGIDGLAQLMALSEEDRKNPKYLSLDGLFGVYSNLDALRSNGAKYLAMWTPSFDSVMIPIIK